MAIRKKKKDLDGSEMTREEKKHLEKEAESEEYIATDLLDATKTIIEDTFNLKGEDYVLSGFAVKKDKIVVTVTNGVFELSVSILDLGLLGISK